jgi:hypothetical protein
MIETYLRSQSKSRRLKLEEIFITQQLQNVASALMLIKKKKNG